MIKRKLIKYNDRWLYKEQVAKLKGYYIDNNGDVFHKEKKLTPRIYKGGYKRTTIRVNSKLLTLSYHRLQAYKKYGDRIYKKGIQVRHLDNNPSNNSFENIAIGTAKQNYHDSLPEVRQQAIQKGGDAIRKFNHKNVISLHNCGLSYKQIEERLGIKKGQISWIINHSTESKL